MGKKRTCYALFIEEQYPIISQELTDEGFVPEDGRLQRTIMHRISVRWKGLSEKEKDTYRNAAKEEFAAQQSALSQVLRDNDEAPAEVPLADAPAVVGNWTFLNPDEPLWTGGNCKVYLVQHKKLLYRMMATLFDDAHDYNQELRVLNEVNKQESASFHHEVFLVAMESTVSTSPVRCLVQQWLPMLDEIAKPMRGSKLAAVACQLAQALTHLHELGILHLDVRGKSVFWSERECLAKLGRFHRSRAMDNQEPLLYPPYAASHRPPECFLCPLAKMPMNPKTESWAFAVTLVKLATGKPPFKEVTETLNFNWAEDSVTKNEAFESLPDQVRLVMLRLLAAEDDRMRLNDFLQSDLLTRLSVEW